MSEEDPRPHGGEPSPAEDGSPEAARPDGDVSEAGAEGAAPDRQEDPIRVVVVDDTPRTVDNLRKLLEFEDDIVVVGTALNAASGIREVERHEPDVLLMDVNLPDLDGIRATEEVGRRLPRVAVILISVQEDREYLRRAMAAGAREYLVKPFSADELVDAVRHVHGREVRRGGRDRLRARRHDGPENDGPESQGPENGSGRLEGDTEAADDLAPDAGAEPEPYHAPPPAPLTDRGQVGMVTAVFSGKGGVGKSVVAVNLAADLARVSDEGVALVDLDLQFGDVAVMLGVEPAGTFADIARAHPELDGPFVGSLMPESGGGVRVLAAPLSPELADLVEPGHVRLTIEILKHAFGHVVLDMSQHLDDVALEALECSDRIVLITDLQLPAIKDAKLAFRLFEHLGIDRSRIRLVLNRADSPADVTPRQLEQNLRWKLSAAIPSAGKAVIRSVQKGTPLVLLEPDSPLSARIRDLVGTLIPLGGLAREEPRSGIRRLFNRGAS